MSLCPFQPFVQSTLAKPLLFIFMVVLFVRIDLINLEVDGLFYWVCVKMGRSLVLIPMFWMEIPVLRQGDHSCNLVSVGTLQAFDCCKLYSDNCPIKLLGSLTLLMKLWTSQGIQCTSLEILVSG